MHDPDNDRPPLRRLRRQGDGFCQSDPVAPWLGLDYGEPCDWRRLREPKLGIRADVGLQLNHGEGSTYGVQVHYVGARFCGDETTAPEQGRMIAAVLAPHHGRIPAEENFYCACDSVDEDLTQVARVLLDQYSVDELFGQGSLLVVVEHEFVETWPAAKQEAALRLVIDHLARRWKRLRRVAVHVAPPSFNREALPTDPPALQLEYRDALTAEWARVQGFHLSPPSKRSGKTCRNTDLWFSLDRRFDPDESLVELLRHTGKLPLRPTAKRKPDTGVPRGPRTKTGDATEWF
jgi:hypothetical protein